MAKFPYKNCMDCPLNNGDSNDELVDELAKQNDFKDELIEKLEKEIDSLNNNESRRAKEAQDNKDKERTRDACRLYPLSLIVSGFITSRLYGVKFESFNVLSLLFLTFITIVFSFIVLFFVTVLQNDSWYYEMGNRKRALTIILIFILFALGITAFINWVMI